MLSLDFFLDLVLLFELILLRIQKQPFYELKWGRVFQNVTTTYHLMAKEFGADLKTIIKEFENISPEILRDHLPNEKSNKIKGTKQIYLL